MKKGKNVLLILFLGITLACTAPKAAQAAVNEDGSVTINEENFPDERFRLIASAYDTNKDNVLSLSERSVLKELVLEYIDPFYYADSTDYELADIRNYTPGVSSAVPETMYVDWRRRKDGTETISVKGIEYFPELRTYNTRDYFKTEGSLRNNVKLEEISLCMDDYGMTRWEQKCENCSRIEQDFPMNQLKAIRIGSGFECKNFSLRGAEKLEELQIGSFGNSHSYFAPDSKLGKVDLSANKKLKKLSLQNVKVKMLDLRKNTKLQEINIAGDRYMYDYYKSGKSAGELYMWPLDTRCSLKLPKNNSIKKLVYMTQDDKLDLTSCKKLTFLQVDVDTQVKFTSKWYKSYGKKKLALYMRGTKIKKKIQKRYKKYVFVEPKELKNICLNCLYRVDNLDVHCTHFQCWDF